MIVCAQEHPLNLEDLMQSATVPAVPASCVGANWSYNSGTMTFFDTVGEKYSDTRWALNGLGLEPSPMVEVAPEALSAELSFVVGAVRQVDGEDRIAYLGVNARQAMYLYLEGILTREALKQAVEDAESITVTITLDRVERKLRITAPRHGDMAAYDAEHRVVA